MNTIKDPVAALDVFMREFSHPARHGLVIRDLPNHPVHRRSDRGNSAAYFSFPGLRTLEAHVSEIAPGETTQTHRHNCEALFCVLAGRGHTVLWTDEQPEQRIQWQAGDLFFTPIQFWHRHTNTDPVQAARYLEITTIPLMKSLGAWSIEVSQPAAQRKPETGSAM